MPISRHRKMRILVACEWSNTVRDAFLRLGHDAYSCDLQRAEHPNPNWRRHIQCDVRPLLREEWDLVIAHPPCTYLCNSGVRWLTEREGRMEAMHEAILFFKDCLESNTPRVCVENPVMHGQARRLVGVEPTQMVHPWQFGDPYTKATYLWLRGLPQLTPTNVISGRFNLIRRLGSAGSKERSRTFQGIADAMATQWGHLVYAPPHALSAGLRSLSTT